MVAKMELSDEILMAYADGFLDEEKAERVRQAMAENPEVRRRISMFQDSRLLVRDACEEKLREVVPEKLVQAAKQEYPGSMPDTLLEKWKSFLAGLWATGMPAYALVAVLAVVFTIPAYKIIFLKQTHALQSPTAFLNDPAFGQALETTPSGHPAVITGTDITVVPISTFPGRNKQYCRQFDAGVVSDANAEFSGISCRDRQGRWQVQAFVRSPAPGTIKHDEQAGAYEVASGANLLESISSAFMTAPPLNPEKEAALIRKHWNGF